MQIDREVIINRLTEHYYSRLGELVANDQIEDSKAVYEEYIVNGVDPDETNYQWMLLPYINGGIE